MKYIKFLFVLFACIFAANFAAHNDQYVRVDLFPIPAEFDIVFFAIILAAILFGVLLGGVFASARATYWKIKYKRLTKNDRSS
jgi:uncharacterized integral membrane protein